MSSTGQGRACRGDSPGDNSANYFQARAALGRAKLKRILVQKAFDSNHPHVVLFCMLAIHLCVIAKRPSEISGHATVCCSRQVSNHPTLEAIWDKLHAWAHGKS